MTYMTPRSEVTNVKCKTHLLHSVAALHFGELEELREFWGNKTSKGFAGPGLGRIQAAGGTDQSGSIHYIALTTCTVFIPFGQL